MITTSKVDPPRMNKASPRGKSIFYLYRKQMLRLYIDVFFTLDIVLESSLQEISFSTLSISVPRLVSVASFQMYNLKMKLILHYKSTPRSM